MILITTEEIAVYVKKEIIRELFTNVKGFNHCGVIDLWISGKTLDRYISKVSQYFLNETKEQLAEVYNNGLKNGHTLFIRKSEYEKILNNYLSEKYNVEQKCLEMVSFKNSSLKQKKEIQLDYISKLEWTKTIKAEYMLYDAMDKEKNTYKVYNDTGTKRKYPFKYNKMNIKLSDLDYTINELIECIERTYPIVSKKTSSKERKKKRKEETKKKNQKKVTPSNKIYEESLALNMLGVKYRLNMDSMIDCVKYIQKQCKYNRINNCLRSDKACYPYHKECILNNKFMAKVMITSQEKNKIAKKEIIKEIKTVGSNVPSSQPMIHKIGVKDFIIRGNVFRCMHKSHQIQNVDAEVKVSLNNGEDKLFQISAGYCQQCNVYFIMESTYQELKRKGIILCRITDSKTYAKGGFMNGSKLAQESILMQYGYNVSQTVGLSARQRQKILAVMIDNKVLSKSEIISYLDFFIRQHGSRNNMGIAISKWEDDREFVEHYKSGEYTKFGVNAIYRR